MQQGTEKAAMKVEGLQVPAGIEGQHVEIKPGLRLVILDSRLREDLCLHFETEEAPYELTYHLDGLMHYSVNNSKGGKSFWGKPGFNVASSFPFSEGTMEFPAQDRVRAIAVHIEPQVFLSCLDDQSDLIAPELASVFENGCFSHYFQPFGMLPSMSLAANQILECPFHGSARKLFLESKTLELLVLHLTQLLLKSSRKMSEPNVGRLDRTRIQKARDYLLEDFQNPPSLFQLASLVGMTHTKLNRGFKAIYGTTVFGYLRQHRLEQSRLMMETAEMNIAEIAYATGFSSPSHFAKAFLNHFGIQPSAYLKEITQRRFICLK
ncbi:helix-turn-helix transcriptional regulator [Dethiosulfatarculus sandiegensis]|uniref:HTH araC/xylS-type domain-containing protein n=1 Tax=Dethiosulfatarculus sandiegensis TaxID=1429043 RepID=A0A0D2JBL7_9BACT|nr:AraC family transcriptional regulator [Dethiosulfatarculus sandiegensis]KIX13161.1 hypothetical protein X474_15560 [Dethiosulfatarculus sandiegensis]